MNSDLNYYLARMSDIELAMLSRQDGPPFPEWLMARIRSAKLRMIEAENSRCRQLAERMEELKELMRYESRKSKVA